jgi:hypothetical protein
MDPALVGSAFQDAKKHFHLSFLLIIIWSVDTFTSSSEMTSQFTIEIKEFQYFFGLLVEGSGSVQITTDPDPGGLKTYGF